MSSNATLSADGTYRYELSRVWDRDLPQCTFIMLNPSTADAKEDDPTIRRCIGFAKAFGCGSLVVVNLYALRSTDPRVLWLSSFNPVGPLNDSFITSALAKTDGPIIAAWGANAKPARAQQVMNLARGKEVLALGINKDGSPKHPLYLPKASVPVPFSI